MDIDKEVNLNLHLRENDTLASIRVGAFYNQLITGYKSLRSLRPNNN